MKNIQAEELILGEGSFIHETAMIRGLDGKAKKVSIGDQVYIGDNVQIICDDFSLGDYSKIQHHTNIHGYKPCSIGHNAWIGQYTIIDSIGGTTIGNNCGIGAHSQLWSHIKYGDVLEGSRFHSDKPLLVGNDVWFVGHCIVSPITAADKSMAMVGSVITSDMEYNTIYAGVPAKSISEKVGGQFEERSLEDKLSDLQMHLNASGVDASNITLVRQKEDIQDDGKTYFVLADRQYTKRRSTEEIAFMKYLLPEKGKFTPYE